MGVIVNTYHLCPYLRPAFICCDCHLNQEMDQGPAPARKRGRPRLEPTAVISVRLPLRVLAIIQRRAAKANMSPGVYLAQRVIHNEVVRKHW